MEEMIQPVKITLKIPSGRSDVQPLPCLQWIFFTVTYPILIKADILNCFLCNNVPESNEHLWNCVNLRDEIKNCFLTLGQQLMDLLNAHADKHSLLINDSIKYSKTFRWAFRNEDLHPAALLLLKSYVSQDLVGIFRAHFNSIKTIIRFLLPFFYTCSITFKSVIWKSRNEKWKHLCDVLGLTKQSFKDYRKNLKSNRNHNNDIRPSDFTLDPRRNREFGYISPFNNNFRNFKLEKDFLFILFTSSNFLHSGPFFSHLECNEFIDYSSPLAFIMGIPHPYVGRSGEFYELDKGVDKNERRAFEFYMKSADQGYIDAQYKVGYIYNYGTQIDIDKEKAFNYFKMAAKGGNVDAQYSLASLYERGEGAEKNIGNAIYWYKKAAENGCLEAEKGLNLLLK
ncbi:hypothetical protein RhiirA4_467264 [Rhizophagus irregularis]|uniref:HCP-like protein n=1 Tax=Rhizophagus irregularis TaxID=588596 RepID=A0A2I1GVJ6_9GLOM|nr:hypothetical protein RhiirA4_467264 [Rhizophagus irregularis]